MKRISILSAAAFSLVFGVSAASAQYVAGTKSLGGTFDFTVPEGGDNTLLIAPSFGYSLSEKLAVGAEVAFGIDGDVNSFAISPFLRGNLKINDRAGAFARVLPTFSRSSYEEDFGFGETEISSTAWGVRADAGLYYWISQRFSMELRLAQLSFLSMTMEVDGDEVADGTDFRGGVDPANAAVSVFYHF